MREYFNLPCFHGLKISVDSSPSCFPAVFKPKELYCSDKPNVLYSRLILMALPSYDSILTCAFCYHADDDFSVPANTFFPIGSDNTTMVCVNVTIFDDLCYERNHSFSIHLGLHEDNVLAGAPIYAFVNIIDDERTCELEI